MKKILIVWFAICICSYLKGQDTGSYIHFNMGGGTHQLGYKLTDGNKTTALGYTANLAYSYFFLPQFGVQTGLGIQAFNANSVLNGLVAVPDIDADGDSYELRMHMKNWKEGQKVTYLDLPLQFQFKSIVTPKFKLLTSLGAKFSMPISGKYEVTDGEMSTTGYYSKKNLELHDLPQHGFSTITERYKGSINLKSTCLAILDIGGLIQCSRTMELYLGGYANYGLTKTMSNASKLLYQHDGIYNGLIGSTLTSNENKLSVGIKLGVYFKMGRMKPKVKPVLRDTLTDSDKDGVPDFRDKCPDTPKEAIGFVDKNGCSLDTDGDGVPDYLDKCPNTPIEARSMMDKNGCPIDTDGDGVPDYLDKCPGTVAEARGKVDQKGCPLDTDGDGIPDYLDRCPTIAGVASNNGCPEIKKEVKMLFKKAMQGIQFQLGKYAIKPISFQLLNDIVSALQNNPSYLIEIQGHTDNIGREDANKILSENRARAVKSYLESKGVDSKRLISHGYGDVVPVADNSTPAGRALNRRVEFIVSFEKVVPGN